MGQRIKGLTITLHTVVQTGTDPLGGPIYEYTPVEVENCLVSPSSTDDITDSINLYGKKAVYTIAIPKGDTHEWEDRKVSFFGEDFRVFGFTTLGIEENIPLAWNKKAMVERYG